MATPIRGETRPIPIKVGLMETQKLNANINASIHNRFDIEVIDAQTGKLKQKAYAENVVCNSLWTKLLVDGGGAYFAYIHYGTGTGTPAATDTSLFTFKAAKAVSATVTRVVDQVNHVYSSRKSISMLETESNDVTLTELGIGYSSSAASLCTHAMLKDMNGNQISIAKTATDIINVYATIFVHLNETTFDGGHIHIMHDQVLVQAKNEYGNLIRYLAGDVTTDRVLLYAAYQTSYPYYVDGYLNDYNGPTPRVATTKTYDAANKKLTVTAPRIAAADRNVAGGLSYLCFYGINLSTIQSSGYGWYPDVIVECGGSGMPATTITGEAIATGDGVTKDFATKFPFPTAATVFVDGVADPSVTVDATSPVSSDLQRFMQVEYADTDMISDHDTAFPVAGSKLILYNPLYAKGIASFKIYGGYYGTVSYSDDKVTWTPITISTNDGTVITVPTEAVHAKYWKLTHAEASSTTSPYIRTLVPAVDCSKSIHFTTPPASGAVITANYTTPVIAKDANHVFDFSMTIQLGEYTS